MFLIKKLSKKIVCLLVCGVVLAAVFVLRFTACNFKNTTAQCATIGTYTLLASNDKSCINFLSQFGWQTDQKPVSSEIITIPEEFNETYKNYNSMQQRQGLDLNRYKGKECEKKTFNITNYHSDDNVVANLLVYDGVVIGGDICSVQLNGFMHTFDDKE